MTSAPLRVYYGPHSLCTELNLFSPKDDDDDDNDGDASVHLYISLSFPYCIYYRDTQLAEKLGQPHAN